MQLKTEDAALTPAPPSTGLAIRALPGQYFAVLRHPTPATFRKQKGRAAWGICWLQMLGLAILSATLQSVGLLISPPAFAGVAGSSATLLTVSVLCLAIFTLILTPASFLAVGGLLFLIVRACGGRGTYLQQVYTTLLFGVPLVLLSYLLYLIPGVGYWLLFVPHIYSAVLFIIALRAVHWQ
jgi:Yip1 domain